METVPRLIAALVSHEQRIVMIPKGNTTQEVVALSTGEPIAPVAYNGNNAAFLTAPVVSAGAVAYGVVPGYIPSLGLNNTGTINNQPEPGVVTFTFRNVEVLAALQKMTGQDFEYDIPSWRQWMSREYNPTPKPSRRVVQP